MLDWLLCGVVKALGGVLCRVPPETAVRWGEALGGLGWYLQPKRARLALLNLHAAYGEALPPEEAEAIVRRIFRNLVAVLFEMLRLPIIDEAYIDRYVEIVGREHFDAAEATGRPIIMLTGHFGNWELTSIYSALKGYPMLALARVQDKFPRLYRLLVSYRESKGCRIVHKGGAMRQLLAALKPGDLVGIVGDQASRNGRAVEFYGRAALFASGPFELARSTGALIIPGFAHRVRGPHHRMALEPPIDVRALPGDPDAQVLAGIERFAAAMRAHIDQDPSMWLWLHKRWKHTPTRCVAVLSDGKRGHVKQSLAAVEAMKRARPDVRERVLEVRWRRGGRVAALLWAWLVPGRRGARRALRWCLQPESWCAIGTAYADVVVSCGASTAPANLLLSAWLRAKSVVVMDPAPLPLRAFDLAFVPAHDAPRAGPGVVPTLGALTWIDEPSLRREQAALVSHARFRPPAAGAALDRRPVVAVFLGGSTEDYDFTPAFAETLMRQVLAACDAADARCLVTTSRRTPPAAEARVEALLADHPRCALWLRASRDHVNGTLEGMLGWARVALVTGESISMVSEACAAGRTVLALEPPRRRSGPTKASRFLRSLLDEGLIHTCAAEQVEPALRRALADPPSPSRAPALEATLRDAVSRVL
jgi:KDO2-lipid IV(A) lauroyltransferase